MPANLALRGVIHDQRAVLRQLQEKVASHAEGKGFGRLGAILRDLGKSYREDAKREEAINPGRDD